jgi:hypothetical protein
MVHPSNMNRTKIIVGIVIIAAVAVIGYGTNTVDFGENTVRAFLTIENGGAVTCEENIPEGSTVFDVMTACNIPFEEEGGFVTSINGVSQDATANMYWIYYVNGEMPAVGAGEYIVQDGDEITWKLESF